MDGPMLPSPMNTTLFPPSFTPLPPFPPYFPLLPPNPLTATLLLICGQSEPAMGIGRYGVYCLAYYLEP